MYHDNSGITLTHPFVLYFFLLNDSYGFRIHAHHTYVLPHGCAPVSYTHLAGLRIGEACGLAWQDANLEEQCLTIRRSIRYDGSKRKYIILLQLLLDILGKADCLSEFFLCIYTGTDQQLFLDRKSTRLNSSH